MAHLTPAQLLTLKTAINADPVLAAKPMTSAGAQDIATAMNALAVPNFTVWKTSVSITQVGDNFVGTELAGVSSLNQSRLQTIAQYSPMGINPSLTDRRQFFDDVFSGAGGALTRPKLLALWKRLATRGEKLFATGTGSDAAPATMVIEGALSSDEIQLARES